MTHLTQAIHHLRRADPSDIDALPPQVLAELGEFVKQWWMRTVETRNTDPTVVCLTCHEFGAIVDGNGDEQPCPECRATAETQSASGSGRSPTV